MYIKELNLNNYRNYKNQKIVFNNNINILYGNNAQGKTNIVEAIYLCAYGKSFRAKKDKELIKFNENTSKVEIKVEKKDRSGKINAVINDKKTFYINDIKQNKISDIIGKINIVIFTPDDISIIKEGPARRRKFLDMFISSLKPNYIHLLNSYNNALEQRNNYLRLIKTESKTEELLDVWDEQLSNYSYKIYQYRKVYIEKIEEKIDVIHKKITKCGNENIKIKYISNGKEEKGFLENLKKTRKLDIKRGFTSTGIHRDDFIIYINDRPITIFGSQGQQRTIILTLKLCELQIIKEEIDDSPILLLDDFMSELDENRRVNFFDNVKENQVIITCTDKFEINNSKIKYFNVREGIVT